MNTAKARGYMITAHAGQFRKYGDNVPYSNHPANVHDLLVQYVPDVTEEQLMAALLHDTVEDTDTTLNDIFLEFGEPVAALVGQLTTPPYKGNRAERKAQELDRLGRISGAAQTVKYADIMDNIKDIAEKDPDFALVYMLEKRNQLTAMNKGNESFRNTVWLKIKEYFDAR